MSGHASELSASQWDRLIQASRDVKEAMLGDERPETSTRLTWPPKARNCWPVRSRSNCRPRKLIARCSTASFLTRELADRPAGGQSGFQEFGLPYAADPAVTRHLAEFLTEHRRSGLEEQDRDSADRPDLVLFNGGVMAAPAIRRRIIDSLTQWFRTRR